MTLTKLRKNKVEIICFDKKIDLNFLDSINNFGVNGVNKVNKVSPNALLLYKL